MAAAYPPTPGSHVIQGTSQAPPGGGREGSHEYRSRPLLPEAWEPPRPCSRLCFLLQAALRSGRAVTGVHVSMGTCPYLPASQISRGLAPPALPRGPPHLTPGILGSLTLSGRAHQKATLGQLCGEGRTGPRIPRLHQGRCKFSRAELNPSPMVCPRQGPQREAQVASLLIPGRGAHWARAQAASRNMDT